MALESNKALVRQLFKAINTGDFATLEAHPLARVADGVVVEYLGTLDWTAALMRLGLFPAMGA